MDEAHDGSYAREPQLEDFVRLARALNTPHVRCVLISGFAVIAHGARTTRDIDLIIDAVPATAAPVRQALQMLEDKAVNDVADADVARYLVVRVADELLTHAAFAERRRDVADVETGAGDAWRWPRCSGLRPAWAGQWRRPPARPTRGQPS